MFDVYNDGCDLCEEEPYVLDYCKFHHDVYTKLVESERKRWVPDDDDDGES